eukprot:873314_1
MSAHSITIWIRTSLHTRKLQTKFNPENTLYDVSKTWCDDNANDISPENVIFVYKGKELKADNNTLANAGINKAVVQFSMRSKMRGGGLSVPGPNLKSELIQNEWSDVAPAYRTATNGLNIEWEHNGKRVIGQIGYTTDKNKFPQGIFDAARHKFIKMAYCPSEN